jgi:hypothetical protein
MASPSIPVARRQPKATLRWIRKASERRRRVIVRRYISTWAALTGGFWCYLGRTSQQHNNHQRCSNHYLQKLLPTSSPTCRQRKNHIQWHVALPCPLGRFRIQDIRYYLRCPPREGYEPQTLGYAWLRDVANQTCRDPSTGHRHCLLFDRAMITRSFYCFQLLLCF